MYVNVVLTIKSYIQPQGGVFDTSIWPLGREFHLKKG